MKKKTAVFQNDNMIIYQQSNRPKINKMKFSFLQTLKIMQSKFDWIDIAYVFVIHRMRF